MITINLHLWIIQRLILDIDDRKRIKSGVGVDPVPAYGAQLEG